jgi:uncharacterized tellurite resistance protein B-like protein
MGSDDEVFQVELLKLLLQTAWADMEVQEAERGLVLGRARAVGLPAGRIAELEAYLDGRERLPPPDLGLLRWRREEVLDAVREVLYSDSRMLRSEEVVLQQIEALLEE